MKALIIVRHGEYEDGKLSDHGRNQMDSLARSLVSFVKGGSVLILTSDVVCSRESAEILGRSFGATIEESHKLYCNKSHRTDLQRVLELVRTYKDNADVIVLVSHFECVGEFPAYFANTELNMSVHSWEIEKGGAWAIDCEKKEITHVWAR